MGDADDPAFTFVMTVSTRRSPYFASKKKKKKKKEKETEFSGEDITTKKKVAETWDPPKWTPPRSPFNLIQEDLFHDPWKLLVATIFLNRTDGKRAVPLATRFLDRWPTPERLLEAASEDDIADLMRPLGLHRRRAANLVRFTREHEILASRSRYPCCSCYR